MIQGQASSHLISRVILYHVELNTYSSFYRSNTRFTSPQICHMLPLDQVKHRNNSGTKHTSNSFDFHEWAYNMWGMTRCTKQVLSKECMPCQSMGWGSFSQIWFNLEHLPKIFNSVWSKDKLLHTLFLGLSCTMLS